MTTTSRKITDRLEWHTCDCCGGSVPAVDGDNGSPLLPRRLKSGGECVGSITIDGLCGAYRGWDRARIERYVARSVSRRN